MLGIVLGFLGGAIIYLSYTWIWEVGPFKNKEREALLKEKAALAGLSNPAKAIMKTYNGLPESAQNLEDLEDKLRALDAELGIDIVNEHFGSQQRNYATYAWYWALDWNACDGKHGINDCKFYIYRDIAKKIDELKASVAKQQEILQLANIEDLDMNSLMARIRIETEVADQSAQELKKNILGA